MITLRSLLSKAQFTTRATASLDMISKHRDWESTVILEDDGSGFYGPDIPLRRIEERGRTYLSQACELSSKKSFEESNSLLDRALEAFKGTFGEEYPEIYDVCKNKAKNFFRLKNWDQGFEWYHKALQATNAKVDNRSAILEAYVDMAWVHAEKEDYEKAEFYYTKCFDIINNELDKYHTLVMTILDDMAHMYHKRGNLEMALTYHYRALGCVDNLEVSDQPFKAKILVHIAQLQTELGDPQEALRCAKIAQELYEKSVVFDNPPELVWCYNTIGWALFKESKYVDAQRYFQKAVDLEVKIFGHEKSELAPSWEGMKAVFEKTGQQQQAQRLEEKIEQASSE